MNYERHCNGQKILNHSTGEDVQTGGRRERKLYAGGRGRNAGQRSLKGGKKKKSNLKDHNKGATNNSPEECMELTISYTY